MKKEKYGLTRSEYRKLIEDDTVKSKALELRLTVPKSVFRYRRLGFENDKNEWVESKHWKDDVNGICMFSMPDSFNKNDIDDCKVNFDIDKIFDYMFREYSEEDRRIAQDLGKKKLTEYCESLQRKMLVGCFTSVKPEYESMWDDPNFGDKGRGICIEYEVDDANFRPDNLAFLPILYDDVKYDNTRAMEALVDYAKDSNNVDAQRKLVCLGYGHTLVKASKYEREEEWRLMIPLREDGAHLDYFNVDHKSKRDFTTAVKAIYLGPEFDTLPESEKYIDEIFKKWGNIGIPVYRVHFEEGQFKNIIEEHWKSGGE